MDSEELKLECLKIASTGDSRGTITRAQEYFEWVTEPEKKKPVRKTKPKE